MKKIQKLLSSLESNKITAILSTDKILSVEITGKLNRVDESDISEFYMIIDGANSMRFEINNVSNKSNEHILFIEFEKPAKKSKRPKTKKK